MGERPPQFALRMCRKVSMVDLHGAADVREVGIRLARGVQWPIGFVASPRRCA